MAESGGGDGNTPKKSESREERLRVLRERQAEERLLRLEELKKHALEAQQFREQKEAERRRRMEETREKENERRAQVEGRKKQIWEAERERREAILRKNQERDARLDAKRRNERSSIVFAFGSSTPRLLETSDSMVASYWGTRRATSTVNLRQLSATNTTTAMTASVIATPRRPSEREQDTKKRASSAGGLYRNPSGGMTTSMYEVLHWSSDPPLKSPLPPSLSPNNTLSPLSAENEDGWSVQRVGRRKTDLMPTTPSPRDASSRPGSGSRSLARTPGDVTPSRPGSVMSQSSVVSASTLNPRLRSAPRRPRPSSIHVTGVTKDKILSPSEEKPKLKENNKAPLHPKPTVTKKQIQQKNEEIKKSQQTHDDGKKSNVDNNLVNRNGKEGAKKEINNVIKKKDIVALKKDASPGDSREEIKSDVLTKVPTPEKPVTNEENKPTMNGNAFSKNDLLIDTSDTVSESQLEDDTPVLTAPQAQDQIVIPDTVPAPVSTNAPEAVIVPEIPPTPVVAEEQTTVNCDSDNEIVKGQSAMTRSTITTEEEAKAKLAERRRQAREQAEREAEAERQRLAKEAAEEEERLRKEEEEQRLAEEEQLRLIEEARKVEEQRLMLAIQEAQKREEEEKERRRLEEQARIEKEEADRLAREEAERQRIETAERLKKEDEERQARRKRVEAIMKRTRPSASANKADCEKGEEDGAEHEKDSSKGKIEEFLHGERLLSDRSLTNGQGNHKPSISVLNEENHANGLAPSSGITNEDCVNSNSPLSTPLIAFQGKKETPVATDFLA